MDEKAFPRSIELLNGETVPVLKVHYPMGRVVFRVQYAGPPQPRGCLALWEADRWRELDHEEYLAAVGVEGREARLERLAAARSAGPG